MKHNLKFACVALMLPVLFQSCKDKKKDNLDRFTASNAKIVVDESFRPIVDEELYIFKALDSLVHPTVSYAPENLAINLFLEDSVRIAVISRPLSHDENQSLVSRNIKPVTTRFAIDAVTLIVNQASTDTTITVSDIKKMLNGNTKTDKRIVFDNPNSGLVRYLKELSGSKDLKQKNIYSLNSNKEVIKYVSENPDAIGITGFSWLNDPDKDYAAALAKVKIVSVGDDTKGKANIKYYSPSQNTLALKQYPLTRSLYIINSTGFYGMGMKFVSFLESDRGQRIILKSGLLPDSIPSRRINIVSEIKVKG
jgi:phosphate transport system substrate-binding protein